MPKNRLDPGQWVKRIRAETSKLNQDNITRTDAYFQFYRRHPEIKWAFLASMVSRNAGWNMCDLGGVLSAMIPEQARKQLFSTYERANWMIFHDAYPQLLVYRYATLYDPGLLEILPAFQTSRFMVTEWAHFFQYRNQERLLNALIINEQNLIQHPVVGHPYYRRRVFSSIWYRLQDLFHLNCVVFPTLEGRLYGDSVVHFNNTGKRIALGKRLAGILFHPDIYTRFFRFALNIPHTGSRYDYECLFGLTQDAPALRAIFPVVRHDWKEKRDWSKGKKLQKEWFLPGELEHPLDITNWYFRKRKRIRQFSAMAEQLKRW
ncbi:hypothetical protein BpJC7_20470 [Weizmannia acidilactici]|uniref:DUF2515 domain-containing protein n=1 Tax=Weizmannia acidilactici TaxID=2607726 RepID=A0A5J4JP05_9BACI|nr:DUF2515 family protein [Weizmannia acidilactici]GER67890.1 hypothetical protein BpJC4_23610 [Weizmannia acidilactici]GER70744.1 hypothetical protein BpJC7_20470 [Weizmannia acidilactici]GER73733.1 hypothetical protein BpPP18_18000 [Weizmannia acidilactici]